VSVEIVDLFSNYPEQENRADTKNHYRPGLMFYELNTFDPFGTTPWKRSPGSELQGTFGGDLDILIQMRHSSMRALFSRMIRPLSCRLGS
jgi:hypothetical protein